MRSACKGVASLFVLAACLWLGESGALGQPKPLPLVAPNPQAPVLNAPAPLGMQRGATLELTLTGTNLAGPTGLWTSFPAKVTIPSDDKNGQDNGKLKVRLEVPADAPIGYHAIRLATTRGMSNLRLFCIDDLAQVLKQETAKNKQTPQAVPVPCVVVGRINQDQGDYYKISVQANQCVSFDLLGRRLGGPIDPMLSIYSIKTGRELAHDNDAPGCQTDPRLTYVFKEAGDYLIEVKDTLFRGGADYHYRLRIGDFPCATAPVPLAARRGSKVKVEFAGPMVAGVAAQEVAVPKDAAIDTLWLAPKGASGLHGWPVALAVTDLDERVEHEPNNEPAKANEIPLPGGVTGRFEQADDVDCYRFAAKKGQKVLLDVETLELYSPTIVYLVVKNAKGAELAKSNPAANPPLDQRIEFNPPEDGNYIVEVTHLNYQGGPSEVYHLTLTPVVADFDLSLGIDRYDVAPGSMAVVSVRADRRGYNGPIEVSVQGGPAGLKGTATLKTGETAKALQLTAEADTPKGPHVFYLVGKATIEGKLVERRANVRASIRQSLGNLAFPPRHLFTQLAVAVKERPPFALTAKFEPDEMLPGAPVSLVIEVKRDAGFDEAITLNPPSGLPPGVPAPKLPPIAKGQNEVKVKLAVNPKVPFGEFLVVVGGSSQHGGKPLSANSTPGKLSITRPFELKIEPASITLKPGEKAKLKVMAIRKAGYKGPIAIELRKLPANVAAAKAVIPMDQDAVELEIAAAANAAPAQVKNADALGTATAAANLQNNSPAFVLTIGKK